MIEGVLGSELVGVSREEIGVAASKLYLKYAENVRPLILSVEVMYEVFPVSVYNEIRAFNDHIARCYQIAESNISVDEKRELVNSNLSKADGHIERMLFDCYKFLNVKLFDRIVTGFERDTKRVDLAIIGNGEFYIEYKKKRQFIVENLHQAKRLEGIDRKDEALVLYDKVYNMYRDLDDIIIANSSNIDWAKRRVKLSYLGKFLLAILTAVITGIIADLISFKELWRSFWHSF